MPKVKMPRKSTTIDMTAMCDVGFLLLTFFMLATKFKPDEPVTVITPSSVSEITMPDNDVMLLTVDKEGRLFFSIDNPKMRKELITKIGEQKGLNLTEAQKVAFANGSSVGVPFSQLPAYLNLSPADAAKLKASGIPTDTTVTSDKNELALWIKEARYTNPKLRICIKADGATQYPVIKDVIATLEGWKIHKFNLITDLKAVPPGTALFEQRKAGTVK